MIRAAAIIVAVPCLVQPAMATADLYCNGDGVVMDFVFGAGIADVRSMAAAGRKWETPPFSASPAPEPIYVTGANDSDGDDKIVADFGSIENGMVIATLRTFKLHGTEKRDGRVSGGVFWMEGVGEWIVTCESP